METLFKMMHTAMPFPEALDANHGRIESNEIIQRIEEYLTKNLDMQRDYGFAYLATMLFQAAMDIYSIKEGQHVYYEVSDLIKQCAKVYKKPQKEVEETIKSSIKTITNSKNIEVTRLFGNTIGNYVTIEQFFTTILQYLFIDTGKAAYVATLLKIWGISTHLEGHEFIKSGVFRIDNTQKFDGTDNSLHKILAEEYIRKPSQIKSSISYAIDKAYKKEVTRNICQKYFGEKKPDNLTFIIGIKSIIDELLEAHTVSDEASKLLGYQNLQGWKYVPWMIILHDEKSESSIKVIAHMFKKEEKQILRDLKYLIEKLYKMPQNREVLEKYFKNQIPDIYVFIKNLKNIIENIQ